MSKFRSKWIDQAGSYDFSGSLKYQDNTVSTIFKAKDEFTLDGIITKVKLTQIPISNIDVKVFVINGPLQIEGSDYTLVDISGNGSGPYEVDWTSLPGSDLNDSVNGDILIVEYPYETE